MPRDAGRMVSKLTADDRPVFAHRWMVRALDVGPHRFNPLCLPKAFIGDEIVRIRSPAGAASALHPPDRLLT